MTSKSTSRTMFRVPRALAALATIALALLVSGFVQAADKSGQSMPVLPGASTPKVTPAIYIHPWLRHMPAPTKIRPPLYRCMALVPECGWHGPANRPNRWYGPEGSVRR